MSNPYFIRLAIFASGERFPLLVERESGIPIFDPTIYCVSELRARNKATNTIDQALRSIMILMSYLKLNQIDLNERLVSGTVFNLSEIDSIVSISRNAFSSINFFDLNSNLKVSSSKPLKLEKVRSLSNKGLSNNVCSHTAANRIRVIRDYLKWQVNRHLLRNPDNVNLRNSWLQCLAVLNARIPKVRCINTVGHREGLDDFQIERLLHIVNPNSEENPWLNTDVKIRNNLIVLWFLSLGIRRGELLNIKISDVDSRSNMVTIARRADDKDDPRHKQPLVKTRDRVLELSPALLKLTLDYVIHIRNKSKTARKNEFLFVSVRTGAPLSLSAVNKIFKEIGSASSKELSEITPHVLRHTWNEIFSAQCDESGIDQTSELEARKYAMGWKDGGTAATYLKRYIARIARKESLAMQEKIFK